MPLPVILRCCSIMCEGASPADFGMPPRPDGVLGYFVEVRRLVEGEPAVAHLEDLHCTCRSWKAPDIMARRVRHKRAAIATLDERLRELRAPTVQGAVTHVWPTNRSTHVVELGCLPRCGAYGSDDLLRCIVCSELTRGPDTELPAHALVWPRIHDVRAASMQNMSVLSPAEFDGCGSSLDDLSHFLSSVPTLSSF